MPCEQDDFQPVRGQDGLLYARKAVALSCQLKAIKLTAQESSLFALRDFQNTIALFAMPSSRSNAVASSD